MVDLSPKFVKALACERANYRRDLIASGNRPITVLKDKVTGRQISNARFEVDYEATFSEQGSGICTQFRYVRSIVSGSTTLTQDVDVCGEPADLARLEPVTKSIEAAIQRIDRHYPTAA